MNVYGYAAMDPVLGNDPSGLCTNTYDCCIEKNPGNPEACGGEPPRCPQYNKCQRQLAECNGSCESKWIGTSNVLLHLCYAGCQIAFSVCVAGGSGSL